MLDITTFFSKNEHVTIYQPGTGNPEGKYVLYWMQRTQRGYENAALNAAIVLGNGLPVADGQKATFSIAVVYLSSSELSIVISSGICGVEQVTLRQMHRFWGSGSN